MLDEFNVQAPIGKRQTCLVFLTTT